MIKIPLIKKKLLINPHPRFVKETGMSCKVFIKEREIREWYKSQ